MIQRRKLEAQGCFKWKWVCAHPPRDASRVIGSDVVETAAQQSRTTMKREEKEEPKIRKLKITA